jgi:REP element-mobilizing transposase RayT
MQKRRRNSLRLQGNDYSQPGNYFITICVQDRRCILGKVVNFEMRLSVIGLIVRDCWAEIPSHFPNVALGAFQIMPNHLHGVITIEDQPLGNVIAPSTEDPCRGLINQTAVNPVGAHHAAPRRGSLSTIVRSFKSAVTRQVHDRFLARGPIWQRSFYDHIIRSDIDRYFIENYIQLNPIMWELDSDNPDTRAMTMDELERTLRDIHGLDGYALQKVIDHELAYRNWASG